MVYVQSDYWKNIVRHFPDEALQHQVAFEKDSIPKLKAIAALGDPTSAIYQTIEIAESDLALYEGEIKRRAELGQKKSPR